MHVAATAHVSAVKFQSTPPVAREAMPSAFAMSSSSFSVSIHAPRCREAMLGGEGYAMFVGLFQSTPPVAGEAMRAMLIARTEIAKAFQSTPPVAGRRCGDVGAGDGVPADVSIHAPRCREAMQMPTGIPIAFAAVSIHAPRCREAMHCAAHQTIKHDTRFNPRPPLPGGDARAATVCVPTLSSFQSTPPVAGRRCVGLWGNSDVDTGFNPRPPLPGGDA